MLLIFCLSDKLLFFLSLDDRGSANPITFTFTAGVMEKANFKKLSCGSISSRIRIGDFYPSVHPRHRVFNDLKLIFLFINIPLLLIIAFNERLKLIIAVFRNPQTLHLRKPEQYKPSRVLLR